MKALFDGSASISAAQREWRALRAQIEAAHAELARLQAEIAAAESSLAATQTVQVLEANEALLLAALRAQTLADSATEALDVATRSAERDLLTELPNRLRLFDRAAQALASARRRGMRSALLFVDLNKFKQINDSLGHAFGDEVLKRVAHCLAQGVRESDTVSRYGGDEFVILLAEVAQAADAGRIAAKLLASLGAPWRIDDHVLRLTASVGISVYPDDGEDAGSLINKADAAMYRVKQQGQGGYGFHAVEPAARPGVRTPPLAALQQPATDFRRALAECERRNVQQQEANQQLVLAAMTAQRLQAAAEAAMQRHTDFLAALARELSNPVAPTRTAVAMLNRPEPDERLMKRAREAVERQRSQLIRLVRLVGNHLHAPPVESGRLALQRRPVELIGVVDAALQAWRPAFDSRLQRLVVEAHGDDNLTVDGDPDRLAQVLVNLLDNASKYTPEGGEIGLTVAPAGEQVAVSVYDTGIGMTSEALPGVFEPFMRGRQAIGASCGGIGLGLTVVRELVTAHGGKVTASSAGSGLGSRFVVTLPRARATRPPGRTA